MADALETSYDEVPYESKPLYAGHPDCLAVAAHLRGLASPLPSRCRVLELGCAAGGNLIPLAYSLPDSEFVGVDLSQRQISDGQELCAALQLPNIKLHAASIADIDKSWGKFDYIICHGVFSWVPPEIQDHILWICRHLLSQSGVAYISYNTNPGWRLKNVVRDLMRFHSDRFDDPQVKVQQARSILTMMANAASSLNHPLSQLYSEQATSLPDEADYYLYHEHLEELNQAFYFREFVAKARAAELEYLGEAWHHTVVDNLPADVQEQLQAISADLIELEQFVDFIVSRTFRRTLLVHREAQFVQTPDPSVVERLFFSGLARPDSSSPEIVSDKAEKFITDDGKKATTNIALLKAVLMELYERWPQALSFHELITAVIARLNIPSSEHEPLKALLAAHLVRGYVSQILAVHVEPFKFSLTVAERPRASRLARVMALRTSKVAALRHRLVTLTHFDRLVLLLADGTRNVDAIADSAAQQLADQPDPTTRSLATDRQALVDLVNTSLQRLAKSSLLEP